jgi:O-methyltransferase involved in polyketide biosynthesis
VDLTGTWKETLIKAGFEPGQPSVWLLEGFLFYIPTESISLLLDEVDSLSASDSWLAFDIINGAMLTSRLVLRMAIMAAGIFRLSLS